MPKNNKIIATTLTGALIIESTEDTYKIVQDELSAKFYVTSERGYNGYKGDGHNTLAGAINAVKLSIKNS